MSVQGRFWILTIPKDSWDPILVSPLPPAISWIKGQAEEGEGGYQHWQVIVGFKDKLRLRKLKEFFTDDTHAELTRSSAADEYVHKDDTSIPGTRFEFGLKPIRRNKAEDWDRIRALARSGNLDEIPSRIYIQHRSALVREAVEYLEPTWRRDIQVFVYWGSSGSGKSRRAYEEAEQAGRYYLKNPNTKWWDSYRGQENVIIDDFTGKFDIGYMLRWLDIYPCTGEIKGAQVALTFKRVWITSNLSIESWYPDARPEQIRAIRRRCTQIVHFDLPFQNQEGI